MALILAAYPALSCGGSTGKGAAEPPGDTGDGELGGRDTECCCQRYDENGSPTGANISDTTACKSTGGICTDDDTQCAEE